MSGIKILYKPDSLGWEDLAKCQKQGHIDNKATGVYMKCSDYNADELKSALKEAITLVAFDEVNTLAGMLSIDLINVNRWWHKGEAAYICYVAVLPEFKGKGIYKLLSSKAEEIIREKGVKISFLHTHINNKVAIKAYERDGYKAVRFSPGSGTDYYSIEMAKWLNGGGNNLLCHLMFLFTKLITRILYKPGKKRRF